MIWGTHNKPVKLDKIIGGIRKCLFSARFRIILMVSVLAVISTVSAVAAVEYSYISSLINSRKDYVCNEAVLMSAEFTDYKDLSDARNDGMYENLMNYSALNQVRIRVVDRKYMVSLDTYAVDTGKTIVSSKVINVYENSKAVAEYNRKVGNIEAVSPIYNNEGSVIAVLVVSLDISDIRVLAGDAFEGIYMIVFVVITFIIVCSIVLSYFYIRRYKKALKVVEDVDFGYIDKRVEVKGSTELKDFATHFNSIMDKNSELDSSRSEFVSNVSHELKTPITSIKVLADSLNMQEDVPVEVYKEFMEDIVSEIDRENKIIEDLLCMVRLDRASSTLNISSVNMNELLELVLKDLSLLHRRRILRFCLRASDRLLRRLMRLSSHRLYLILLKMQLSIIIWMAGYMYRSMRTTSFYVRVEDSGIGIPKDSQGKVFERFYRVDKARSRGTGGTGLGLSIVKNIILMHHGTIKLYSEGRYGNNIYVQNTS